MIAVTTFATLAITCKHVIWFCRTIIQPYTIRTRSQLMASFMEGTTMASPILTYPVGIPAMGNLSPLSKLSKFLFSIVCPQNKILLQIVLTGRYSNSMICGTRVV